MLKWHLRISFIIGIWLFNGLSILSIAQSYLKPDPYNHTRKKSFSLGAFAHTYGIGISLDQLRWITDKHGLKFGLDIASYKNRRENRIESLYRDQGGKPYIYDKLNYCYLVSFQFGFVKPIIRRTEFSKLHLSAYAQAGFSLAMLKPYLVEVAVPIPGTGNAVVKIDQNSSQYVFQDIVGEADFFTSMSNFTAVPGLRLKSGTQLDIATNSLIIRAVDIGLQLDIFGKPLPIMDITPNPQYFLGGYIGLMIGNNWD
ncbi:MAG: hypothetical protein LC115_03465 [Bacteroidia bacterium]|nr:hypothetical protein [Bacteroidia bacterium]